MVAAHLGAKERMDNEFWLLEKLAKRLEMANFQELPREHITAALSEHPVYEGVLVHVDMKKYDVVRFWVLSEDEKPLDADGWFEKIRNILYVRFKKWPKTVPTYKRVVLAVRTKKQNKLMLKAFKDIPKNGLEYFLPEGKITMSKYDKGFIATTVSVGVMSILVKIISKLTDYQVPWTYIVGGVTSFLALKSWNAYKNKRNKYLVNLSKSLYFKTIANNRALLTLIVDRAEDEVFKSALIAYTFIRVENLLKDITESEVGVMNSSITMNELKSVVDNWLKIRYSMDVDYDPQVALKLLEEFGLLKARRLGEEIYLTVSPLDEAVHLVPTPSQLLLVDREEDLDVEDIYPENDFEILDRKEQQKECKAEGSSTGWE